MIFLLTLMTFCFFVSGLFSMNDSNDSMGSLPRLPSISWAVHVLVLRSPLMRFVFLAAVLTVVRLAFSVDDTALPFSSMLFCVTPNCEQTDEQTEYDELCDAELLCGHLGTHAKVKFNKQ